MTIDLTKLGMFNLEARYEPNHCSLSWQDAERNRHHIFVQPVLGKLYGNTEDESQPVEYGIAKGMFGSAALIYKNPPAGCNNPYDVGYFETRKLDPDSKANAPKIAAALEAAPALMAVSKAEYEERRRIEAENSKREIEEQRQRERFADHGAEMLAAFKELQVMLLSDRMGEYHFSEESAARAHKLIHAIVAKVEGRS